MKKIILIPDSFKGTMSSVEVCNILKEGISKFSDANIISVPVADGGEGSVDAFLAALDGEKRYVTVKNPYFEDMKSFYGVLHGGKTAVIEMAACAGLPLVEDRKNPCNTTTYGVGQLMLHAVESGCENIILGLGGSATNDAGAGCAAAVGVRFTNKNGNEFVPVGGTLSEIAHIDIKGISPRIKQANITIMCDIDNPLFGENGAAYIFGPQKGADKDVVKLLDNNLKHFSNIVNNDLNIDVSLLPGGGAAGGMGAGLNAMLGGELHMGIETVLDTVGFDTLISGADLVISGEGRIDGQSARGKVVAGVARRTSAKGIPTIAIVGDVAAGFEQLYGMGLTAIFSINRVAVLYPEAKLRAKQDLASVCEDIFRLLKALNK